MSTLSERFDERARDNFAFLVGEFGFAGPSSRRQGWQFSELLYRSDQVAIRVSLDNEEQVLVYVHVLIGDAMPSRDDVSRTFLVDTIAPALMRKPRGRNVVSTGEDLDQVLSEYALATRTHMPEILQRAADVQRQAEPRAKGDAVNGGRL
jgi:hypothetical protein